MGFAVFYALTVLINMAWVGFEEGYSISEADLEDGKNIFEKLSETNLINGINDLSVGIQKLGKISNPGDLLGGLAISASGTLQLIGGVVTFPLDIFGIITGYYENIFPPIVGQLMGFIIVIAVGFVLISAKLGFEL